MEAFSIGPQAHCFKLVGRGLAHAVLQALYDARGSTLEIEDSCVLDDILDEVLGRFVRRPGSNRTQRQPLARPRDDRNGAPPTGVTLLRFQRYALEDPAVDKVTGTPVHAAEMDQVESRDGLEKQVD